MFEGDWYDVFLLEWLLGKLFGVWIVVRVNYVEILELGIDIEEFIWIFGKNMS